MPRLLHSPAPALLVACLALAVSLGGVGYAATVLPRNSVGTPQLKKGAVTTVKLRNQAVTAAKLRANAVTSQQVRDGSLLALDFRPGQLPAGEPGPRGDKGDKGDTGPAGPPGVSGLQITLSGPSLVSSISPKTASASCPSGKQVLGGGALVSGAADAVALRGAYPADPGSWTAMAAEVSATALNWSLSAWAICGTVAP